MISIAIAQSASVKGDLDANIAHHGQFVKKTAGHGVRMIIFPELSLTGYEPELAKDLALRPDDKRLYPLKRLSEKLNIILAAGAPVLNGDGQINLSILCFYPDHSIRSYAKQHLHHDEKLVFSPGREDFILDLPDEKIALAICADISDPMHARRAADLGATLYAASVLVSYNGYETDARELEQTASRYRMTVFMANHSHETGGYIPAGRSAVWDRTGRLLARCQGTEEALIIANKNPDGWDCRILPL
jgi:predicted amidohydrolase